MYCFVYNREHKKCTRSYDIRCEFAKIDNEFAKIDKVSHKNVWYI